MLWRGVLKKRYRRLRDIYMLKNCKNCKQEFKGKPKTKYCSKSCMAEDYKTRFVGDKNPHFKNGPITFNLKCETCKNDFFGERETRRFCSHSCSAARPESIARLFKAAIGPRKQRKQKTKENNKTCPICSKGFWRKESGLEKAVYCSIACRAIAKTQPKNKCKVCSVEVPVYRVVCSMKCRDRYAAIRQTGERSHLWQGGKTSAAMKIRGSAEYGAWRRSVFERDDYTCVHCGQRGGKLSADHIKPFSTHPELRLSVSNGRTLCIPCHLKTDTWGTKALRHAA